MRALQAEGVDTAAVARTDAPTTLSLIGLDAHGVPAYAFYGEGARRPRCVHRGAPGRCCRPA